MSFRQPLPNNQQNDNRRLPRFQCNPHTYRVFVVNVECEHRRASIAIVTVSPNLSVAVVSHYPVGAPANTDSSVNSFCSWLIFAPSNNPEYRRVDGQMIILIRLAHRFVGTSTARELIIAD